MAAFNLQLLPNLIRFLLIRLSFTSSWILAASSLHKGTEKYLFQLPLRPLEVQLRFGLHLQKRR